MFNLNNNFKDSRKKSNPLKSLYEVECFLRNLSCAKNSICFINSAKHLLNKGKRN